MTTLVDAVSVGSLDAGSTPATSTNLRQGFGWLRQELTEAFGFWRRLSTVAACASKRQRRWEELAEAFGFWRRLSTIPVHCSCLRQQASAKVGPLHNVKLHPATRGGRCLP